MLFSSRSLGLRRSGVPLATASGSGDREGTVRLGGPSGRPAGPTIPEPGGRVGPTPVGPSARPPTGAPPPLGGGFEAAGGPVGGPAGLSAGPPGESARADQDGAGPSPPAAS